MKKPISPHLSIYAPQISSVLSIAHRLSGLGLALASPLLVWGLLSIGLGEERYHIFLNTINQWLLLKLIVIMAVITFCYHFLNGIRHLAWDIGLGFSLWQMRVSGILTLLASLGLAFYLIEKIW